MPFYHKSGEIPTKRHTQFRKPDGSLYSEELVSTEGFSSVYSLVYHCHPPTLVKAMGAPIDVSPKAALEKNMQHRSFVTFDTPAYGDYIESRKTLLFNSDIHIGVAAPKESTTKYFFKNADADEVLFIHEGSGKLLTLYGEINFKYGDYLVIPRGTIYQLHFNTPDNRMLVVESPSPIYPPKRYQNSVGQLMEHSPYCERDIKLPVNLKTNDQHGDYLVYIKKQGMLWPYTYATHPFDAIGWDGYLYPFGFSIHNFEPITGRLHMPPPIHQTFEGRNFVICSFVGEFGEVRGGSKGLGINRSVVNSGRLR